MTIAASTLPLVLAGAIYLYVNVLLTIKKGGRS